MVLHGDVGAEVAKLKQEQGKNILKYGLGGLDQVLVQHGLIDEFRLSILPLVLGEDGRLFD